VSLRRFLTFLCVLLVVFAISFAAWPSSSPSLPAFSRPLPP
jgi:hypothetical protein